jgi:hypothetical protein
MSKISHKWLKINLWANLMAATLENSPQEKILGTPMAVNVFIIKSGLD